jgi:hypothetical protein
MKRDSETQQSTLTVFARVVAIAVAGWVLIVGTIAAHVVGEGWGQEPNPWLTVAKTRCGSYEVGVATPLGKMHMHLSM